MWPWDFGASLMVEFMNGKIKNKIRNMSNDGEAMRQANKVMKADKVKYGRIKFGELKKKFIIQIIFDRNNIIKFTIGINVYYYGVPSCKIRKSGEKEWTTKIVSKFKSDLGDHLKSLRLKNN